MDETSWRDVALGRPCWHCSWWGGWANATNSLCDRPNASRVTGQPEFGCVFFEREPGADDDLWEPRPVRTPVLTARGGRARR